jgi:hypothetical protein
MRVLVCGLVLVLAGCDTGIKEPVQGSIGFWCEQGSVSGVDTSNDRVLEIVKNHEGQWILMTHYEEKKFSQLLSLENVYGGPHFTLVNSTVNPGGKYVLEKGNKLRQYDFKGEYISTARSVPNKRTRAGCSKL